MRVLWAVLLALSWCPMGFIGIGILSSLLVKSYTFNHWKRIRLEMRISAVVLGPFMFFFVIGWLLCTMATKTIRDKMSIWTLPDWILAGFTDPPRQPKEGTLDSPTVSP